MDSASRPVVGGELAMQDMGHVDGACLFASSQDTLLVCL